MYMKIKLEILHCAATQLWRASTFTLKKDGILSFKITTSINLEKKTKQS